MGCADVHSKGKEEGFGNSLGTPPGPNTFSWGGGICGCWSWQGVSFGELGGVPKEVGDSVSPGERFCEGWWGRLGFGEPCPGLSMLVLGVFCVGW